MSTTLLTLGRLALPSVSNDFKEGVSEPLDTTGAGVALGQRRPKLFGFELPLLAMPGASSEDLVAVGLRFRRQLRSMLQNPVLRGQGIYLAFSVDPEINGWVMVGNGQIAYADGNVGFGNFLLTLDEIYKVASLGTHRAGVRCRVADRRLITTPRDFRQQIFSTDFAGLTALSLFALPPAIFGLASASGNLPFAGITTGANGNTFQMANPTDGDVFTWEQAETNRNLGQVVAYDRRGHLTAPTTGPDALWEEAYGPDYKWNWLTPGQPPDVPVLANDRCRVRYDQSVGVPGLRVDVWTGSAWAEQGKVIFARRASPVVLDDTWQSASLVEYTGERAVISVVLASSTDGMSHEQIYISLQRGWEGPRVEMYVPPDSSGLAVGGEIDWYDAATETNCSVLQIVSGGVTFATAVNSATLATTSLGPFINENYWALLAQARAAMVVGAVVQANATTTAYSDASAYGATRNAVATRISPTYLQAGTNYLSVQFGFPAQVADQTLEAEAIRQTSATSSQITDATASNGLAVKDTQTAQTSNTLNKLSTALTVGAVYRVLIRVKVDSGATGTFAALSGGTGGIGSTIVPTSTSTAWAWVDAGELTIASTPSFQVNAWRSAGASGAVYVDRVELYKLRGDVYVDGAREIGQAALMDARGIPVQIER